MTGEGENTGAPDKRAEPPKENKKEHVIRHLLERTPVQTESIMHNSRYGALHSTSLETIQTLVKTGKLPGHSPFRNEFDRHYQKGDVFAFPTFPLYEAAETLNDEEILDIMADHGAEGQIPSDTLHYASNAGERHAFLSELNIPLSDREASIYASELFSAHFEDAREIDPETTQFFAERGYTQEQLDQAKEKALQRKGFLICIDPRIKDAPDIQLAPGDIESGDMIIRPGPEGLSYEWIAGIQPLGPIEQAYLDSLRLEQSKS